VPGSAYSESPIQGRFFDRIAKECFGHRLGSGSVYERVNSPTEGSYFLDIASKLYYGETSPRRFRDDVSSFYPGTSPAAIDCILARVPRDPPPKPGLPLGAAPCLRCSGRKVRDAGRPNKGPSPHAEV
jgi:hypothetical protein